MPGGGDRASYKYYRLKKLVLIFLSARVRQYSNRLSDENVSSLTVKRVLEWKIQMQSYRASPSCARMCLRRACHLTTRYQTSVANSSRCSSNRKHHNALFGDGVNDTDVNEVAMVVTPTLQCGGRGRVMQHGLANCWPLPQHGGLLLVLSSRTARTRRSSYPATVL